MKRILLNPAISFYVFGVVYLLISASRPIWIIYGASDETLFMDSALHLIQGEWLGPYNAGILSKGAGYPLFLASNYVAGLPINVGNGLIFFFASFYISSVIARLTNRPSMLPILLVILLTLPVLYEQSMQRLLRDSFYSSITLLYFGALLSTAVSAPDRLRLMSAALFGLSGAVLWLTREEGIWVAPATVFPFVMGAISFWRSSRWRALGVLATRAATGSGLCIAVVLALGFMNLHAYGRFVVNEIKDSDFQDAMTAIQRVSGPDRIRFVPVTRATRILIYKQSPSFARLQSYIDPPNGQSPTMELGCQRDKKLCGEIAGDWFVGVLRSAVASIGEHSNPAGAANFYKAIASEIESACSQKRLLCSGWWPPLIPLLSFDDLADFPSKLLFVFKHYWLLPPMNFKERESVFLGYKDRVLMLLNNPPHYEKENPVIRIKGWFRSSSWISVIPKNPENAVSVARKESRDLVAVFSDPLLTRNRFEITANCDKSDECIMSLASRGSAIEIYPRTMSVPVSMNLAGETIYIDSVATDPPLPLTARSVIYRDWSAVLEVLHIVYPTFLSVSLIAFAVVLGIGPSVVRIVVLTLAVGVVCRAWLLALIASSSFPVIHYTYCAPAIVLVVVTAGISVVTMGQAMLRRVSRWWGGRRP